ncbi:helix-turn-helix domain-containing protein [Chenggangzhangella methanolivorans]|uniref:Helix-turn-helix domain-containing protein n=1 Tax=Chenggangzhangella methanolivorans TaxID=1437009 RepID=A0A9E6RC80_9HYPH|nr:helix-turn-helix domain-containing protein [Chenggangzhangella methanolivorans]QZO01185.1 helix-turn-helix domain-containing protein [Chenggangzhangella methanolivorans]
MLDAASANANKGDKAEFANIDKLVGQRVRARRTALRMSQTELGEAVGVSFQQIQKYEKGVNRIGASRLSAIAAVLQVPVTHFFEEPRRAGAGVSSLEDPAAVDLIRAFDEIADADVRDRLVELTRSVASALGGARSSGNA